MGNNEMIWSFGGQARFYGSRVRRYWSGDLALKATSNRPIAGKSNATFRFAFLGSKTWKA